MPQLERVDWRNDRELHDLVGLPVPAVPAIPAIALPAWSAPTKEIASTSAGAMGRDL